MSNSILYFFKGCEDAKNFAIKSRRHSYKQTSMENNNDRFIVAEISKNWTAMPIMDFKMSDLELLSQRFEKVINVNRERGYKLMDWKTHVYIHDDTVNETIIAIFEKIDQP